MPSILSAAVVGDNLMERAVPQHHRLIREQRGQLLAEQLPVPQWVITPGDKGHAFVSGVGRPAVAGDQYRPPVWLRQGTHRLAVTSDPGQ